MPSPATLAQFAKQTDEPADRSDAPNGPACPGHPRSHTPARPPMRMVATTAATHPAQLPLIRIEPTHHRLPPQPLRSAHAITVRSPPQPTSATIAQSCRTAAVHSESTKSEDLTFGVGRARYILSSRLALPEKTCSAAARDRPRSCTAAMVSRIGASGASVAKTMWSTPKKPALRPARPPNMAVSP